MKFTNGYWMTKPEYAMSYAQEAHRVERRDDTLRVIALTQCANGDRGALLNTATLTVSLSAPMENVLRVEVVQDRKSVV